MNKKEKTNRESFQVEKSISQAFNFKQVVKQVLN